MKKTTYVVILAIIILVIYMALSRHTEKQMVDTIVSSPVTTQPLTYIWEFTPIEADAMGMNKTSVKLTTSSGKSYNVGTFEGSCNEVAPGTTGIFGEMADPTESSRIQCWFAGGGKEVGVFEEGGGHIVKVADLSEGSEEVAPVRGPFTTLLIVQ